MNILQCDDHDDNRLPTCIQQYMIMSSDSCNKEVCGIRFGSAGWFVGSGLWVSERAVCVCVLDSHT